MKTLTCDLCEHEATAETFEEWMSALKPHYMEKHTDVMNDPVKMADPAKAKEGMMAWMEENKRRFELA